MGRARSWAARLLGCHDTHQNNPTMPSEGTRRRSIRVEDDLWLRAKREARRRDEALADVVRRALEDYVEHRD